MKNFLCVCGQTLYFENSQCTRCGRRLGYDPLRAELLALQPVQPLQDMGQAQWQAVSGGQLYHLCRNDSEFGVCNWLVSLEHASDWCPACAMNQVVPGESALQATLVKHQWWKSLEQAKRRLLYSLLALRLPVRSKQVDALNGLAFAFLEDQRSNPLVHEQHVLTGHIGGLITINLAEADRVWREHTRQRMGEGYRTLLGHFRHESGHYYFEQLLRTDAQREEFRSLFGDERQDYDAAMARYYAMQSELQDNPVMISAYAQAHPLEDWAECWAHYLHMMDTLETAAQYGVVSVIDLHTEVPDIERCFTQWTQVSVMLNALNRSMGLEDAYPFVLSALTLDKLRFVHRTIYPSSMPRQTVASV